VFFFPAQEYQKYGAKRLAGTVGTRPVSRLDKKLYAVEKINQAITLPRAGAHGDDFCVYNGARCQRCWVKIDHVTASGECAAGGAAAGVLPSSLW
jgi:hypothetical protein